MSNLKILFPLFFILSFLFINLYNQLTLTIEEDEWINKNMRVTEAPFEESG